MWFLKHEKLFLKVKKGRRAYKQKKLHMQKKTGMQKSKCKRRVWEQKGRGTMARFLTWKTGQMVAPLEEQVNGRGSRLVEGKRLMSPI